MESQIVHPQDHDQEHNRQPQGEEEDQHEKKSMMTKVKDKAKKIRNTLTKHGQGQEQDPDDVEDDDEEEDPELRPTPIRSGAPGQGDIHKVPMGKFGDTSAAKRDDDPLVPTGRTDLKTGGPIRGPDQSTWQTHPVQPAEMLKHKDVLEPNVREEIPGQRRGDLGKTNVTGEGVRSPLNTPVPSFGEHKPKGSDEGNLGQTRVKLHGPTRVDENTPVQKANVSGKEGQFGESIPVSSLGDHKSKTSDPSHTSVAGKEGRSGRSGVNLDENKVTDPAYAGGEAIGVPPITHALDKLSIKSGTEQNTGSHDQFSAEKSPTQTSSYAEKISSAAFSAKNVVASKLGYGGNNNKDDKQGEQGNTRSGSTPAPDQQQGKGIAATVTEKLTPVYNTVAGAGSTVASKIGGGGGAAAGNKDVDRSTTGQNKGGPAVKEYLSEKLKPGEEDKALSEVITESLHKRKAAEPVGKVTESAEVTRQLGPDQGEEKVAQSSYGKVVADTLKGAVGSLFGKPDQSTPASSPQPLGSSTGTEGFPDSGRAVAEQPSRGGVEQRKVEGN